MGLFGTVKSAAKKTTKAVTKPVVTVAKVTAKPAVKAVVKAAQAKTVAKAIEKISTPIGKKVGTATNTLKLPVLTKVINIKQALTDPKKYVANVAKATVPTAMTLGTYGAMVAMGQGAAVATAIKADAAQAAKGLVSGAMPASLSLDEPKPYEPQETQPSYNQLTGDTPLYPLEEKAPERTTIAEPPKVSSSKMPLILIGGAVALVLVIIMVRK
jgi:hypothetical protein